MRNSKVALFFLCAVALLTFCGFSARAIEVDISVDGKTEISGVYETNADALTFFEKLFAKKSAGAAARLVTEGKTPKEAISILYPTLYEGIQSFCDDEFKPSSDASVRFCPNDEEKFEYNAETYGSYVDADEIYGQIVAEEGRIKRADVARKTVTPSITQAMLAAQTVKRGEYSTYYGYSSTARRRNIEKAVSYINGTVLEPNGVFSFNGTVGARSAARGFLEAPIIVDGKYVGGTGGGVCQVSTTAYNAALMADLEIVTVSRHTLPVSYVPPSFDAMVSSATDFVFRNATQENVYIEAHADGKNLKIVFYGLPVVDIIELKSERIKTLPFATEFLEDNSLPLGTEEIVFEGHDGLESRGYLIRRRADGTQSKTQIRRDVYRPQSRVVKVGIGEPAEEESEEPLPDSPAYIDF